MQKSNPTPTSAVTIQHGAVMQIKKLATMEPQKPYLRLAVNGGGCSGFKYDFSMEGAPSEDDTVIEHDGARILIDAISLPYLLGSQLDYVDELIGKRFEVSNPNASSSCGCGVSFSI